MSEAAASVAIADCAAMGVLPHGGQQVVEPVALNDDVVAHRLGRGAVVAGTDCRDHRVVLGEGPRHAVAHLQLHASVGLENRMQPRGLPRQEGVVRRPVDAGVELRVRGVVGVDVARFGESPAGLVRGLQLRHLGVGDAPRRQSCARRLELGHHLEALGELLDAPLRDEGPALGGDPDEARGLQLLQRLADRGPRAVELAGERLGIEPRPGRIATVDDGVLQGLPDPDRVRNRAHARALQAASASFI